MFPGHRRAEFGEYSGAAGDITIDSLEELSDTPYTPVLDLPELTNFGSAFSFLRPSQHMAWAPLETAPWPLKFRSAEFAADLGCFGGQSATMAVQASKELPRVIFTPILTRATVENTGVFPYVRPELCKALKVVKQALLGLGPAGAQQVNSIMCCNPYTQQVGRGHEGALLNPSNAYYRMLELNQQYGVLNPLKTVVNGLVTAAATSPEVLAQQLNRASFVLCCVGSQSYIPAINTLAKRQFDTLSQNIRTALPIRCVTLRPDNSRRREYTKRIHVLTVGNYPLSLEALPMLLEEIRQAGFGLGCKVLVLEAPREGRAEEDLSLDDKQFAGYPLEALVTSVCLAISPRTVFTVPDGGGGATLDNRGRPSVREPFSCCIIRCTGFWGVVHAQLFSLLAWCYESVTVSKPVFSGLLNNERWIVCKNRRRCLRIPDGWETPETAGAVGAAGMKPPMDRTRTVAAGASRYDVCRTLAELQYQAFGNESFIHLSRLVEVSGLADVQAAGAGGPAAHASESRQGLASRRKDGQVDGRIGMQQQMFDPRDICPVFLDYLYQVNNEIASAQLRLLSLIVLHHMSMVSEAGLSRAWDACVAALPDQADDACSKETQGDTPSLGTHYPSNEKRKKMHFRYAVWLCGGAYPADIEYIIGGPTDAARSVNWRVELPQRQNTLVKKVIVCSEGGPAQAGAGGGIGTGSGKGAGVASLLGATLAKDEVVVPGESTKDAPPAGRGGPRRARPQKPKGGARNLGVAMRHFR